jgi:hypothetical protein
MVTLAAAATAIKVAEMPNKINSRRFSFRKPS